jgi:hypothetical protein
MTRNTEAERLQFHSEPDAISVHNLATMFYILVSSAP